MPSSLIIVSPAPPSSPSDAATIAKQQPRLSAFTTAWQAVDAAVQHRLAPPRLLQLPAQGCGPTVLAMCLAPIPVVSGGMCAPPPTATGDAMLLVEEAARKKMARVSFVVLRVMDAGWGSVEGEPIGRESASAGNSRGGRRGGGGGGNAAKPRTVKDHLSHLIRRDGCNHAVMHSFDVGPKVGNVYHRGSRAAECFIVSPGMVFTLRVWDDKLPKVFEGQTTDVQPFDLAFIELSAKSTNCKVKTNQLDMRRFQSLPGVSIASRVVLPSALVSTSLLHHTVLRGHHHAATHIGLSSARLNAELLLQAPSPPTPTMMMTGLIGGTTVVAEEEEEVEVEAPTAAAAAAATPPLLLLPDGLEQDWIRESLSPTQSLVRFTPINKGTFVVGPDDVLRFHHGGEEGHMILDLPCGTLCVHYDPRQYAQPHTPTTTSAAVQTHDPWVVKLLNVGLLVGAVELLIAVDTYKGRDDQMQSQEPSLPAFARFDTSVLVALMLGPRALSTFPASLVPNYQAQVCVCVYYYYECHFVF
jgi:hypothetical protein